uniref:Uncharacterized protein n=1 Tax=Setaria digitata TaxID=48799 RepID=A0A915Q6Q7_9BILA
MTISWYFELIEVLIRNLSVLLMSLIEPKFIDENDPHAKTLYNIKTEVAFPKRVVDENRRKSTSIRDTNIAISWSQEYESNMPRSLSLSSSSPLFKRPEKYLKLKSYSDPQESSSPDPHSLQRREISFQPKNNQNSLITPVKDAKFR